MADWVSRLSIELASLPSTEESTFFLLAEITTPITPTPEATTSAG